MSDQLVPVPTIETQLTGAEALQRIITALEAAALVLDPEDLGVIDDAVALEITDADDYQRGYALLDELMALDDRVVAHYVRFKTPLKRLTEVVQKLERTSGGSIAAARKGLQARLGVWKVEADRQAAEAAAERQRLADLAAQDSMAAKAATLDRLADTVADPVLQTVLKDEAEQVRATTVTAAPVAVTPPAAPKGAHTRTTWKARVTDVKALMRAWVEGRCVIPDDDVIAGVQSYLDAQAGHLERALPHAYPGTEAVPHYTGVLRRTTRSG